MTAIAIIETALAPAPDEWLSRGRDIAHRKVALEWDMADWIAEGVKAGYDKQLGFDFAALGQQLGIAPPRLKAAYKAAQQFPPALRAADLSVEIHAVAASLPPDEALPLLKRASAEHLTANDCRAVVQQRRYETGERFDDEDTDTTLATLVLRAWNRATVEARGLAFERLSIAAGSGFGIIDEDEVTDEQD